MRSDATFRIAQHGRPTFIDVLLEHQRTSAVLMPWRLLRYMTNVWLSALTADHGEEATGRVRVTRLLPQSHL